MIYTVMVVEDEMLVRAGIVTLLRRCQIPIGKVRDYVNGSDAWDAFALEPPDILLTDIRMSVMDGLTLIERVRAKNSRCRVIVLTCVNDFDTVQRAMDLGVTGYLFKLTMKLSDLTAILEKAVLELRQFPPIRGAPKIAALEKNADDCRERLSADLADYVQESMTPQAFSECLERLNVRLPEPLTLCACRVVLPGNDDGILRDSVARIITKAVIDDRNGWVFCDAAGRFIILLDKNREIAQRFAGELNTLLRTYFNLMADFTFQVTKGYADLPRCYREAVKRMEPGGIVSSPKEEAAQPYTPAVRKALAYIQTHYLDDLTLARTADYVCLTPNYFSNLFKRETNVNFTDYVNSKRIRDACILLGTDAPTAAIARRTGFSDTAYFTRVFKKTVGVTPGAYRRDREGQ